MAKTRAPIRSVVIAGWFGSDNFGDELLLTTLISLLHQGGVETIRVLGSDHQRVTAVHGVEARDITPVAKKDKVADVWRFSRYLQGTDLFIVGPGTVLQERSVTMRSPGTLPLFLRLLLLARIKRIPTAIVGVGVREGGSRLGNLIVRLIGAITGTVLARDEISASMLGPRAQVIGDVAFAWEPPPIDQRTGESGTYAVSLKALGLSKGGGSHGSWPHIRQLCSDLESSGMDGQFLAFGQSDEVAAENDVKVFRAGFSDLLRLDVPPMPGASDGGWLTWLRSMEGHDFLVATRLHAAVVGMKMGIPTVALAYEEKVGRTFALLGLQHLALDVNAGTAEVLQSIAVAQRLASDGVYDKLFNEPAKIVQEAVADMLAAVDTR